MKKMLLLMICLTFINLMTLAEGPKVATTLQCTFSIVQLLLEKTGIQVENILLNKEKMMNHGYFFKEYEEDIFEKTVGVDAVVTIRSIWPTDPLYRYLRAKNVRIVEIDACTSIEPSLIGISTLKIPETDIISPYFYLNPFNVSISADLITHDLVRLYPSEKEQIEKNLSDFRKNIFALKSEYDLKFIEKYDLRCVSLSDKFVYLTQSLSIYVEGYFLKDEYYWEEVDYTTFKTFLEDNFIPVVIHDKRPSDKLCQLMKDLEVQFVVLDSGDPGYFSKGKYDKKGLLRIIRKDLELLYNCFE